ncbi:hypothetical protein GGR50DRAFT_524015 [Xylaria sp. CBS 124048]|nr:hypothetical protein GGR50DRAFT_524015 [Xylaria sp. CBS 124048]
MASYSEANDSVSAEAASTPGEEQQHEFKLDPDDARDEDEDEQQEHGHGHEHEHEHEREHELSHEEFTRQQLAHTAPSHDGNSDTHSHTHTHTHNHTHNHTHTHTNTHATTHATTNTPPAITTAASSSSSSAIAHAQSYDNSTLGSPVPVTTVAHHGLQVLQAASAAPLSPVSNELVQQYAQSAALLQISESQYSSSVSNAPISAHMAGAPNNTHSSQRVTRLRRACDMCSQRKVKCDESGPPCKPCSDLQVECTFRREMKRRGPPNKHAEAARAAKRHELKFHSSPIIHQHHVAEAQPPIPTSADVPFTLDAESIAPWPVLMLLVDDFFVYIHPLTPFPHEPSFRQALASRADRTDRDFLALLASMIGALVASFPRSARAQLKGQNNAGLFPTAVTLVGRCRSIALEARGATFMARQDMSVDDAVTSYYLGIAAGYTLQWKLCRRFLSETMSFCRELSTHRPRGLASSTGHISDPTAAALAPVSLASKPVDHIKDQIGKRVFWTMVASIRTMTQLGASINEIALPPPTTQEPYPAQPIEVDDDYIFSHQILQQPEGIIPLTTGFNRNIRIFMTMNELIGVEMCYGISFFDWSAQKNIIGNGLVSAKQTIEDIPSQLQIVKANPDQNDPAELDQAGFMYCPPAFPAAQPDNDVRQALSRHSPRRRQLQCDIQKANIHASQLATRLYFVERYLNLRDAHPENAQTVKDDKDQMVAQERELIVRDLLAVLTTISQRNLEPNGQSIINKIHQIASTLVQSASEHKGPVAVKAEEYLHRFIDILVKLERSGTVALVGTTTSTMGPPDEGEELKNWAELREYQMQFISSGGFLCGSI